MFANIGTVVDVVGSSTLIREGKTINVIAKLELKEHDFIKTGNNAKVKMFFKDNTAVSLGQNTIFEIDKYFFTGKKDSQIKFKVLKGFFKTVTGKIGKIAPKRFKLQTKNATIGIRGTVFAAKVGNDADVVMCTDGRIVLFTPNGAITVDNGKKGSIERGGKTHVSEYTQEQKERLIKEAGWHGSMSMRELIEYIKNNFEEPLRSQLLAAVQNIYDKDSSESKSVSVVSQNADDISFVDDITINGREFDELPKEIEFYSDDIKNGKVIVEGLLESEDKNVAVEELHVEITTDGGDTWTRAKGSSEWEWRFAPNLEQEYEFSLRVVRDTSSGGTSDFEVVDNDYADDEEEIAQDSEALAARTFDIGGFEVILSDTAIKQDGKISGRATLVVPYLEHFGLPHELSVNLDNLSFEAQSITAGQIEYNNAINIPTNMADIDITKVIISPNIEDNSINGSVKFKGFLSSLPDISLSDSSKFLPSSFSVDVPISAQSINIWADRNVKLTLSSGSVTIGYVVGSTLPTFDMSGLVASLNFGTLLTDADNAQNSITATLSGLKEDATDIYKLQMDNADAFLLGKKIKLSDFNTNLDVSSFLKPKISLISTVDFPMNDNIVLKQIEGANIVADISRDGFSATITLAENLSPITILERDSGKDVQISFNDSESLPSFSIAVSGTDTIPKFDLSGVSATIDFGDIIQSAKAIDGVAAPSVKANIDLLSSVTDDMTLTFMDNAKAYILGTKFAIEGINANTKFNLDTKTISINNTSINLDDYDDPILQGLSGSIINATISPTGFAASITSDGGIDDITLLDRGGIGKDVILKIQGTPSVGVAISENGIDFEFGSLDAKLNFGDVLQNSKNQAGAAISSLEATLSSVVNDDKEYILSFPADAKVYLLGSNFALEGMHASFSLKNKSLSLQSSVNLSEYDNPILEAIKNATFTMSMTPSHFSGTITSDVQSEPIVILDRGSDDKNIKMQFTQAPTIGVSITSSDIDFDFTGGAAKLYFGDFLEGAEADLSALKNSADEIVKGKYTWSIESKTKLIADTKVYLSGLNGTLDISDYENPKISIEATADLSTYGGILTSVDDVTASLDISKDGLIASMKPSLSSVDIWQEKEVKLDFESDPTINIAIKSSGFSMGLSDLHARLNLGTLLNGANAEIKSVIPTQEDIDSVINSAEELTNTAENYSWSLEGDFPIAGSKVILSGLSGSINLSDFTNPSIILNANADLHEYGTIFKYVTSAGLSNAKISKSGFDGTIITGLSDIDIWKDKNVKILFNQENPPKFNLKVDSSGLRVGLSDVNAEVYLGDLLDDATAILESLEDDLYSFSLSGRHTIQSTQLIIDNFVGNVDLSNLQNPIIGVNGNVDLSAYGGVLSDVNSVSLQNSFISKDGFRGDLSVGLEGFDVWPEKNVKVVFPGGSSPTVSLVLTRSDLSIGLSDINANIDFGSLLDGEIVSLRAFSTSTVGGLFTQAKKGVKSAKTKMQKSVKSKISSNSSISTISSLAGSKSKDVTVVETKKGVYKWSLQNTHKLIEDDKGYVNVESIGGTIDLNNLLSPIIVFNADADFTHYTIGTVNLGSVSVEDATISREGIDWNMYMQGASANFTILDLGSKSEDVRVELFNVDGHASSSGNVGVDSADGKLFFGMLFDGDVQPINLTYDSAGKYSFSTTQNFTYSNGDNSIILNSPSGSVEKVGSKYKVTLQGSSTVQATILSQMGITTLSISGLEVGSGGFIGDLSANLNGLEKSVLNGNVKFLLSSVGIHIDSSKSIPFALNKFDGYIDLSKMFNEASQSARAVLSFANSKVNWTMDHPLNIGDNFIFKNLRGSVNLGAISDLSIGLNGEFSYKDIDDLNLVLSDFEVFSGGMSGTLGLANGSKIEIEAVEGLSLTALSIAFTPSNISGAIAMMYDKDGFLGSNKALHVGLASVVDRTGIKNFTIDTNALEDIKIPDFADISFRSVTTSTSFQNFYISIDGDIQPTNPVFSSDNKLEYRGLKISKNGVSIESAGAEFDVSGSDATLGGFSLSLEKVGLGFINNKFYVSAKGALSLASIAEAGAGVKLYSDGDIEVDSIKVLVNNPGITFGGEIAWYKNDPIFGDGFGTLTPLQLKLAGVFGIEGEFKIGTHPEKGFYWMAQALGSLGGSGIPLGPLSIYGLGGGVAYNMSVVKQSNDTFKFQPTGSNNTVIIFSTMIGTPDLGYTWHGKVDMLIDTSGQFALNAERTYILSTKEGTPDNRRISGSIIYANSPSSLQITASANISFFGIGINAPNGAIDLILSNSEKHIYVGQSSKVDGFNAADKPVGISVLGLDATGYFMIDTRQLAFGFRYEFYKKWTLDWAGPDPWASADVYAGAGAMIRYNPFFMLMYAEAGAEFAVGYGLLGTSIGADVFMELAAPTPNYLWARAHVEALGEDFYFSGYIYGSGRSGSGSSDSEQKILYDHVEPHANSDVSIMPVLKIYSMLKANSVDFSDLKLINKSTNRTVAINIDESILEEYNIVVTPKSALDTDTEYELKGLIGKRSVGGTYSDPFSKEFKTTKDYHLEFNEIVKSIKPENMKSDVYSSSRISIKYKDIISNIDVNNSLISNYEVVVSNAKNEPIAGRYQFSEYALESDFIPSKELKSYHFCVRDSDGAIKETFKNNQGQYLNPFNSFLVDGTISTDSSVVIVPISISRRVLSGINLGVFGGTFSSGSSSSGSSENDTYSYYSSNKYNIVIRDKKKNQIVYNSVFWVSHNDVRGENILRFDALKNQLSPSIIIHFDVSKDDRARITMNPDFSSIGVVSGSNIKYKINTIWDIEGQGSVEKEIGKNVDRFGGKPDVEFDGHTIQGLRSASMVFMIDSQEIFTIDNISFSNGATYSSKEEEDQLAEMQHIADDAERAPGLNGSDGMDVFGGFGNAGGSPVDLVGGGIPSDFDMDVAPEMQFNLGGMR